jgi:hypothetical protein
MVLIISQDGDILVFKKEIQSDGKIAVLMKKSEKISSIDIENIKENIHDQNWETLIVGQRS